MHGPQRPTFVCIVTLGFLLLVPAAHAEPARRSALGSGLESFEAPAHPETREPSRALDDPSGEITLDAALAAALRASPELAAASWEVRSREMQALQAGLRPNPVVTLAAEDFAGGGSRRDWESAESSLSVAQVVELGGKRPHRRAVASHDAELAGWDYESRRVAVHSATTRAFFAVVAAQERVALSEEELALARRLEEAVRATVRSGAVSPVEEARARVTLGRAELERSLLEERLAAARTLLAASWGASEARFRSARGDLGGVTPPPTLEALLAALETTPQLARFATELARREAALDLARARRLPDPVVGVGGRHYADEDVGALTFEVSVPLPAFDRNQGAIASARHDLERLRAERAALHVALRSELARAHQELRSSHAQAVALRETIVPEARAVYDQSYEAYTRGLFRHVEVLDAQRTFFETRAQELDALLAWQDARAEVERLTGTPLEDLSRAPVRQP